MPLGQYSLSRLATLQPTVQPIFESFLAQAEAAGIPCDIVQGTRTFAEQQKLYNQGIDNDPSTPKVTNAKPGDSYHQYGLAVDVVPRAYRSLPEWNPSGPLWERLGQIGEAAGLTWGGRWGKPDKPHFHFQAAPLSELKAFYERALAAGKRGWDLIMPVEVSPTSTAIVAGLTIAVVFWFYIKPQLERHGIL